MKKRKKLDYEERETIEVMLREGHSQRSIAKKLKRSPSTISKEISLNSQSHGYTAHYGAMLVRQRQSRAKRKPRKMTSHLKKKLKALLKKDYSPEQISGLLHEQGINISHETIYQWIWANKQHQGKLYR